MFKKINLENILQFLLKTFLFTLPWQTIYIFQGKFIGATKIEWWTQGFYATEILLWVIVVVFMGWYWKNLRPKTEDLRFKITKDRIFVLSVLVFLIYIFSSIFWAFDKSLALQQSLRIMEMFLLFFMFWFGPINFEKAVKWLLYGSVLPCLLGIGQFLFQTDFAFKWFGLSVHPAWQAGTSIISSDSIGRWLRAYGPFAHPNIFGGYLVMVIGLFQIYDLRFKNKNIHFIFYSLLLSSLFFTFSRSAWLVLITFCVVKFIFDNNNLKSKILNLKFLIPYFVLVVILLILFFPLVQTRLSNQSISEVRSTTERVSGYKEAWQIFKANPIFGVGAGNYTLATYNLNPNLLAWEIQPVHNVGLLFIVEFGVVGVVLLLSVIYVFIRFQISLPRRQAGDLRFKNMYCWLCAVGCVLLAMIDHYLYSSYIGLVFSGVFFGLIMRQKQEEKIVHNSSTRTGLTETA